MELEVGMKWQVVDQVLQLQVRAVSVVAVAISAVENAVVVFPVVDVLLAVQVRLQLVPRVMLLFCWSRDR